ncbi:hypothetical protein CLAIMM_06151 [Cladophialophora immunda]|nr:hypothetical protein CLAIMM_06151 [Cladophialophora immunda]
MTCKYCRREKLRCAGFDTSPTGRRHHYVRFNHERAKAEGIEEAGNSSDPMPERTRLTLDNTAEQYLSVETAPPKSNSAHLGDNPVWEYDAK